MKKITKILISVMALIFVSHALFAETASSGLTDSDVKNFIKNFDSIEQIVGDVDLYDLDSVSSTEKNRINKELNKLGITGNGLLKVNSILKSSSYILMFQALTSDPSMSAYGALIAEQLKEQYGINSKDLKVVEKNFDQIAQISQLFETPEEEDEYYIEGYGASGDYDYMETGYEPYSWEQIDNCIAPYKEIYEALSKPDNYDPGFIYETADSKHAKGYKLDKNYHWGDLNEVSYLSELYLNLDKPEENCSLLSLANNGEFQRLGKELYITLSFPDITEDDYNKNKYTYLSRGEIPNLEKEFELNIQKVELYRVSEKNYEGREYVLYTKEGPVIHLLEKYDKVKDIKNMYFSMTGVYGASECYFW